MASSSSSVNMAFPRANGSSYDVFLSFRGIDTRDSFTDHLYDKLVNAGIRTFRDDDEIDGGQELKSEIKAAIKASEASIIVISENYATSTWCLEELWLILEEKRESNHFVLPVFYHVDPSDIKEKNKAFNIQAKASTKWTHDNVERWKTALRNVVGLKCLVLSGPEAKFMNSIVDKIYKILDRRQVYLPRNLIRMDAQVEEINSRLKQSDAQFLVICGMGGSGKSTLAQYIVYSDWSSYENISIVECIDTKSNELFGLLKLQRQLLKDITGGKNRRVPSVCQGAFNIEEVLKTKRALIVLDEVAKSMQLDSLLGSGNINKQSKVIITTMENDVDMWFNHRSISYEKYKMQLLDDDASLKLLCLHAFGSNIPREGYEQFAKQIVRYCEGNPLALEVLGSSLHENNITSWKSTVELLEKDIHDGIFRILKRSYDSLPYTRDMDLFLHIACFFVGKDIDYVVKILDPDYFAVSRIKVLMRRCLVYLTPNKKLMMHRLIQEMGRSIVDRESPIPVKRSRVWRNLESYHMLVKRKGSQTIKGLALEMDAVMDIYDKLTRKKVVSFPEMEKLELLQLKNVEFKGHMTDFPKHLRWLCWIGFTLPTIPSDLFMGNMVALDMSHSHLTEFEPPTVLQSLKVLNLTTSWSLKRILAISRLPNLETLILWGCHKLEYICDIETLTNLSLLNLTGCKNLQIFFSLPRSLERLFLNNCWRGYSSFLHFRDQSVLQFLNLSNNIFAFLPSYNHLKSLRVLDLSMCSRLRRLLDLPSTLAELYVYYCTSLNKVTFESHQFTLQEFGYEGCRILSEVEGFFKLVPLTNLDGADLGHMRWLKKYQNLQLCLAGDDELMADRSCRLQMLYEFNIMSISMPDIQDPNIMPEYIAKSTTLSFDVPPYPKNRRLKGLNVTCKYTISGDVWVWFAKIKTTNGVDLMYKPKVFGKPEFGGVALWLSYWPIGNKLNVGDSVVVSIVVINGLEIHECGASLVYTDDEVASETLQNNLEWADILGGDISRFQLCTGAYYLCRRDLFELMEVGRLTPGWFSILVGDSIDDTEVRGWRKTGRPQQSYQSFTELKVVTCVDYASILDDIYMTPRMGSLGLTMATGRTSNISDASKKGVSNASPSGSTSGSTKKDIQDDDEPNPDQPTKKDSQDDETMDEP